MLVRDRCGFPQRIACIGEASRVPDAWPDAIEPGPLVGAPRCGKGRTAKLLGIEAVIQLLRAVLALRQGAWQRLGLEVVAEARHIARGLALLAADRARASLGLLHGTPPRWKLAAR